MKRAFLIGVLLCSTAVMGTPAVADPPAASADVVRSWNEAALRTVRIKSASDAQAARLYAMVNVAMYDAVNGLVRNPERRRGAALVSPSPQAAGDPGVAAAVAARDVIAGVYPDQAGPLDAQLESELAVGGVNAGQTALGRAWGAEVAAAVLAARANDGSTPNESQPGGTGPGVFTANWSGVQFRNLQPFAIADPDAYVSPGPPALTSVDYAAALAEVQLVGNAAIPDSQKLATYQFWSLGGGTSQPPGAWLQVAKQVSADAGLALEEATRMFALVSMAMVDSVAPTYTTKYESHSWRPTTAIRQADTDGNPYTTADPTWTARAGTAGSSPEHWSGHSSFSAAAATAMQRFFCKDAVPFTLVSDSAPGGSARSYPSFSAAMNEAGRSRVLGGLHFEFSNQAGLTAGRDVAAEVVAHKLLVQQGATHTGECPR